MRADTIRANKILDEYNMYNSAASITVTKFMVKVMNTTSNIQIRLMLEHSRARLCFTHKRFYDYFISITPTIFVFFLTFTFNTIFDDIICFGFFAQRTLFPHLSTIHRILHFLHHTHLRELVALGIRPPQWDQLDQTQHRILVIVTWDVSKIS